MNNDELELELIGKFGLEKTITFCEVNAYLYNLLYMDVMERDEKLNLDFAFDYESNWWKEKGEELSKRVSNITNSLGE